MEHVLGLIYRGEVSWLMNVIDEGDNHISATWRRSSWTSEEVVNFSIL